MAYGSMTYDIHEDQLDAKPRFTPLPPNKQNEGTHHRLKTKTTPGCLSTFIRSHVSELLEPGLSPGPQVSPWRNLGAELSGFSPTWPSFCRSDVEAWTSRALKLPGRRKYRLLSHIGSFKEQVPPKNCLKVWYSKAQLLIVA